MMSALLTVINENDTESSDYMIAMYLLSNFSRLSELGIYDVADACYVSRSGVRRFCNSVGFANFSDLKDNAYEWNHQYHKYVAAAELINQRGYLQHSVQNIFSQIDQVVSDGAVEKLADMIHDASEVAFLSSEFSVVSIKEFQQSLVTFGKIVHILSSSCLYENAISSMDDGDLLITISLTGIYAGTVEYIVDRCNAKKILITSRHNDELVSHYDQTLFFDENYSLVKSREFSKYGISYLFDRIFAVYVKKYNVK